MNLPNTHFTDFPIEFKEINPDDFPHFEVGEKIIISPNEEGYINEPLQQNINLAEKNTLIINAGVGQGKTYSIIEIIKRYYDESENYLIIVAVPYVSLVQQYLNDIVAKGISENDIYRYEYIGRQTHIDAWTSKIQIITVNGLLGNPGEDAFVNETNKRNYLNYMSSKCLENNRKVVFIYDEIHDTIHNFKEKYIFNLWKWSEVIHKNIILSATFNEASKIVIEYLADLTDNKIQIIESKRIRFPEKQSELYLHYNQSRSYTFDNNGICELVENLISKEKTIDILCFSRILANDIYRKTDSGVGKLLFEKFGEIQNCVSDLNDNQRMYSETPQNRFDKDKCNVGTNFKTGISINKTNHAFIVIMPPLGRKGKFKNNYGIFTDGINSIIQALARQRSKGEIHIVLPPPQKFNYETLSNFSAIQKNKFIEAYELHKLNSDNLAKTDYISINNQKDILDDFYNTILKENILSEIETINNMDRSYKIRLEFPELKLFKLNIGEKYLYTKFQFFGGDLSSYITYSAFTNQFINCSLKETNTLSPFHLKENRVQWRLEKYFYEEYDSDLNYYNYLRTTVSDYYFYNYIKSDIFNKYKVFYKPSSENTRRQIVSFEEKKVELQFLAFIQRKIYPNNRAFNNRFLNNGYYIDAEYTRGDYFRACISHSLNMENEYENIPGNTKNLIEAFKTLNYFRNKIKDNCLTGTKGGVEFKYVFNAPFDGFITNEEIIKFNSMYTTLIENDIFIQRDIFDFKRAFLRTGNIDKKKKSFYKCLLQDFFKISSDFIYLNNEQKRIKIIEEIEIPDPNFILNFIKREDTNYPESYWESETKTKEFQEFKNMINPI